MRPQDDASDELCSTLRHRNHGAETLSGSSTIFVYPKDVASPASMLDSLRNDASRHTADYVICETAIAAQRFLAEHLDARRETDRTMIGRGVVGYWQRKTIAVVPISPVANGR